MSCWRLDKLSTCIFPQFDIWSILLKLALFPGLAGAKIVADEVEFVAVATESGVHIPLVPGNAVHLDLGHDRVVVILAVGAATTTCLGFFHLHGLGQRHPVGLVRASLVAGLFRSEHPVIDENKSDVIAGPVTPLNADPDTTTAPTAPTGASVSGFLDSKDVTGFKAGITASWTAKTDSNTSGYVIRWTTQNPATTQNPVWEYGQVEGKATTTFTITGLVPNTLYYWQVTAKSPYNAISWASPQSGTVGPIVDSTMPSDAWAQLRSIISIGGKTADLFKFGTGISQDINTSTTITPSMTSGTYSGIILNKSTTNVGHNYWLNTGQFRVGSATAFLYWDGSDLYTTGKINATGGVFSGNVQVSTGTIYAGASPDSGARVRMNSAGLFAYDSSNNQVFFLLIHLNLHQKFLQQHQSVNPKLIH